MAAHVYEEPWPFAVRIHADWMAKCRTCKHWYHGSEERSTLPATTELFCKCSESPFYNRRVGIDDGCLTWDSYWTDAALHVLQNIEDGNAADAL